MSTGLPVDPNRGFAVLGHSHYDYLDVVDAPDEAVAAKVAMIVRFLGHAQSR